MQKRRGFIASICLITVLKVDAQPPTPPYPDPARPAPFWTWDTIPLAYHGANTTGLFSAETVAQLSKYRMVTIEKWYTPCGQPGPGGSQSNSSCDVEAKMFQTFHDLKAINPNITNIIYLNRCAAGKATINAQRPHFVFVLLQHDGLRLLSS